MNERTKHNLRCSSQIGYFFLGGGGSFTFLYFPTHLGSECGGNDNTLRIFLILSNNTEFS